MMKNSSATRTALVISILLLVAWSFLGTNASIAWFQDEDVVINSLQFGDFKLGLSMKTADGYVPVDSSTRIFREDILFEPGHTQIVRFRVENAGDIDFTYRMSVIADPASLVIGESVNGTPIDLTDYLKFGLVFNETESGLLAQTADRELIRSCAVRTLNSLTADDCLLPAGGSAYCALILYMPEEVANEANFRGEKIPGIDIGVKVSANQIK